MAANTTPLTYTAYAAAVDLIPNGRTTYMHSDEGGLFRIEGFLNDREFLVRGEHTNLLIHARVTRAYRQRARVEFTGYVDRGRDIEGVMVDPGVISWPGWINSAELFKVQELAAQQADRIARQAGAVAALVARTA